MATPARQIRAEFDRDTITVYQAYAARIAQPAVAAQRFVPPFSLGRMTWIKPSFLWLMHRSNWARKTGQEHILAVRIDRAHWEEALSIAVLTSPERESQSWARDFAAADVHVQWDPERSLRGAALNHYSIQVGLGRAVIAGFATDWIREIVDLTPKVQQTAALLARGDTDRARRLLPVERPYPLPPRIAARVLAN